MNFDARWWKVDFHAHSPASFDFNHTKSYEDWINSYLKAQINTVIVCDHHTIDGYLQIKSILSRMVTEEQIEEGSLRVIPGIEITAFGGIHVVGIFPETIEKKDITVLLHSCGFEGQEGESQNITCTKSFQDIVQEIIKVGGMAIPAHCDSKAGIFEKTLSANAIKKIHDIYEDAGLSTTITITNLPLEESTKYASPTLQTVQISVGNAISAVERCNEQTEVFLKKQNPSWVPVLGSDSHYLSKPEKTEDGRIYKYPGSHFTWIKAQIPDFSGIRLAIHNGRDCVIPSDSQRLNLVKNPNEINYLFIKELRITDNSGNQQSYIFNPHMNSLIGGRGVGKSTILETIRIALDKFDELPKSIYDNVNWFDPSTDGGYCSGINAIDLCFKIRGDEEYCIHCSLAENNGVPARSLYKRNNDGDWEAEDGDASRFPVVLMSQKQIFEMSKNPNCILNLIDEQSGVAGADKYNKVQDLENHFKQLYIQKNNIEQKCDRLDGLKGQRNELRASLKKLSSLESQKLTETIKQKTQIKQWLSEIRDIKTSLADISASLNSMDDIENILTEEDKANLNYADIYDALSSIRNDINKFNQLVLNPDNEKWSETRDNEIARLRAVLNTDNSTTEEMSIEEMQSNLDVIDTQITEINKDVSKIADIDNQMQMIIKDIDNEYDSLWSCREKKAKDLVIKTNGEIILSVDHFGDDISLKHKLYAVLDIQEGKFHDDIDGDNGILAIWTKRKRGSEKESLQNIVNCLETAYLGGDVNDFGIKLTSRFIQNIQRNDQAEFFASLELLRPNDLLRIYRKTREGNKASLTNGSPGQRNAVLLNLLLNMATVPLILDQPEDDLENKMITDLIVKTILRDKSHRQIIIATHNANIVVNSDSENILALQQSQLGNVPQIEAEGYIQLPKIREQICQILEGGKRALENRYDKLVGGITH